MNTTKKILELISRLENSDDKLTKTTHLNAVKMLLNELPKPDTESYLFDTDAYKPSHWLQYPPGTTYMSSYIESRGGLYPETVFAGLQYIGKKYLTHRVTAEEVEEARFFYAAVGEPFNYDGWMYIVNNLHGRLPVRIRAVPEGSVVPVSNVLVAVESTQGPETFWAVSWIETLLMRIFYPITVASRSRFIKTIIYKALQQSSDDPDGEILFKLHDFGARGVSSQESAMIGGFAHLINFMGSDTIVGIRCANKYYNSPMSGFSIPASEHSSITSWGKEHEVDAYRNMLKQFGKPNALLACVSDSYDIYNAITNLWGKELKQEVIDSGAVLVIRPDSGEPKDVVLKCLQLLEEAYGCTINHKGYKVLNTVRLIQGDGVSETTIQEILDVCLDNNYSITNIGFGMGGELLQKVNRDTNKFAMKCSSIIRDGIQVDVFKDPITDEGKRSKAGIVDLVFRDGQYKTVKGYQPDSVLQIVFEDGYWLIEDTLDAIRERAKITQEELQTV